VARAIADIFTEVIIAPRFSEAARQLFAKKKNLRLMTAKSGEGRMRCWRSVRSSAGCCCRTAIAHPGGARFQGRDEARADAGGMDGAALRLEGLPARQIERHRLRPRRADAGRRRRPDGPGRQLAAGRVESGRGGLDLHGSAVASEALFPFADGLIAAADAGATAAIQPGGAVRDAEVIQAADERGMAMVFTGIRHFRH